MSNVDYISNFDKGLIIVLGVGMCLFPIFFVVCGFPLPVSITLCVVTGIIYFCIALALEKVCQAPTEPQLTDTEKQAELREEKDIRSVGQTITNVSSTNKGLTSDRCVTLTNEKSGDFHGNTKCSKGRGMDITIIQSNGRQGDTVAMNGAITRGKVVNINHPLPITLDEFIEAEKCEDAMQNFPLQLFLSKHSIDIIEDSPELWCKINEKEFRIAAITSQTNGIEELYQYQESQSLGEKDLKGGTFFIRYTDDFGEQEESLNNEDLTAFGFTFEAEEVEDTADAETVFDVECKAVYSAV